jgi:hypothetical protein
MNDRYVPRRVLGERLAATGFREHLLVLLKDVYAVKRFDYEWSHGNESRRVDATQMLQELLEISGRRFWDDEGRGPSQIRYPYILGASLVLAEFFLETISIEEVLDG